MSTYSLTGNAQYPIVEQMSKTGQKFEGDKGQKWLKEKITIKNLLKQPDKNDQKDIEEDPPITKRTDSTRKGSQYELEYHEKKP